MNRLAAIALHEIQFAVRSRLLVSVAILALGIVILMPHALTSDGTLASRQQILITYTLGAVTWILGVVTLLWASTAISRERKSGSAILVATKPVGMSVVWLGKWLGITIAISIILWLAAAITTAQLPTFPSGQTGTDVLHPQRVALPDETNFESEINAVLDRLSKDHQTPSNVNTDILRGQILTQLRHQQSIVEPGQTRSWSFHLPPIDRTAPGTLEARFECLSVASRDPMTGEWAILDADNKRVLFSSSMTNFYGGVYHPLIPASVMKELPAAISVRFVNANSELSSTLAFPAKNPIRLLIHGGTFGANLVMTLFFLATTTAILAAIGLCCSACFESPTAIFCSTALLLMVLIASGTATVLNAIEPESHHHGTEHKEGGFTKGSAHISEELANYLAPVTMSSLTSEFAGGIAVSWSDTVRPVLPRAFIIIVLLYSVSVVILRRQEIEIIERSSSR